MVSNKSRLLRLYRYLYVNTDERHYTTKAEIMDALKDEETIYSRQTVRDDIDTLTREGYDIETVVSSGNYYYFKDREFTLDELRVLIDAVTLSPYMGKKQKGTLVRKLKGFCSKYQADLVERNLVSLVPQVGPEAQAGYENLDAINEAINRGRKMGYQIREEGRRKKLADDGEPHICTPLGLSWDGRVFRMVAIPEEGEELLYIETDRLADPYVLEEGAAPRPRGFRLDKFVAERADAAAGEKGAVEP